MSQERTRFATIDPLAAGVYEVTKRRMLQADGPTQDNQTNRPREMRGLWGLSDGVCFDDCSVVCVAGEEPTFYENGPYIPCAREFLRVSDDEHMEIRFTVTDENATNPSVPSYGGHWELLSTPDDVAGRVIEGTLADLDGDGHLEFAVLVWSPGSAFTATARIYS